MDYVKEAKALGFTQAALMPVSELVIVPEYRMFCEENLCGNYNVLPACPPASGTVEEMTARVRQHETAPRNRSTSSRAGRGKSWIILQPTAISLPHLFFFLQIFLYFYYSAATRFAQTQARA